MGLRQSGETILGRVHLQGLIHLQPSNDANPYQQGRGSDRPAP
jgi:hypothetical protein